MMHSKTVITAATTAALLIPATPAQAAPATRPSVGLAAGHLVRQHGCVPGNQAGGTGWLLDDVSTPRRELVYKSIDQAGNGGTRHWVIVFTCYGRR